MKTPSFLLLSLGLIVSVAYAGDNTSPQTSTPLPLLHGIKCMDPDQVRGWTAVDNKNLLIDAGRYKYRVEFNQSCNSIRFGNALGFRGDPVTGRVCGTFGDSVVTRDYPCHIDHMQLISKEQYKQEIKDYQDARKARKAAKNAEAAKAP